MLGRVLVLSASAGAGHLRAAEAIEKAIRLRDLASEVQHLDVLRYTNKMFRHLYSKAYIDLVNNAPEVLGWLYDHLDDPRKNDPIRLAFDRLNANPFIQYLKRYQPDVAMCTHFLPSGIISSLKGERKGQGLEHGGGHRFRRPCHVALSSRRAVLCRARRNPGPFEGAGCAAVTRHSIGNSNRSRFRGVQG